ncbi:hypothetical protein [Escherichia coli]|uniref:hypothetical protein n=1 Tax=Escherichia coli TaxID=562 RepID=UPI002023A47C|nr:hypothetical protein [Escherichia coli]
MKVHKRQATVDELLAQINNATVKAPRSFGQLFGFSVIAMMTFMFIVKQIYLIPVKETLTGLLFA